MKNESRFNYTIELSDKTNDSKHENNKIIYTENN